jgi:hypothetical protein
MPVNLGYDIFKELDDGSPLWIVQVKTVNEARTKLDSLNASTPGRYFLRDATTGKIIGNTSSSPDEIPGPR